MRVHIWQTPLAESVPAEGEGAVGPGWLVGCNGAMLALLGSRREDPTPVLAARAGPLEGARWGPSGRAVGQLLSLRQGGQEGT